MKDIQTINKVREVAYVAKNFSIGLTNLVLVVRKPDGSALSPVATFTEQSGGVYIATYTPNQLGVWQEKITSASNGDHVIAGYQVVSYDTTDNQTSLTEISNDTDTIITNIGAVKTELDSVQTTVNDIDTKVTNINNEISTGGYIL